MGNDSDFYIFNIKHGYIPFQQYNFTGRNTTVKKFSFDGFARHLAINPEMSPLLASLVGNDYISDSMLRPFSSHIQQLLSSSKLDAGSKKCNVPVIAQFLSKYKSMSEACKAVITVLPRNNLSKTASKTRLFCVHFASETRASCVRLASSLRPNCGHFASIVRAPCVHRAGTVRPPCGHRASTVRALRVRFASAGKQTQTDKHAKMAECNKNRSSGSIENSDYKTDSVVNKKEKSSFLFYSESNFAWKGDLKSLKAFVATILTCDDAKWSSPRAEEKLFKTAEFSLKWHGPKKEKLQIMKDNENKYLQSVLEANAQTNATKNVEKKIKTRSHVVDANRQQQDDLKQNTNQNHSMCTKCQDYQQQIDNIMTLVAEIKTKQLEETQRAESKSAKLEININALSEQNNKMAAEIEQLKSTIVELDGDNANIKCVLDIKQNEWTKVDTKAKKSVM